MSEPDQIFVPGTECLIRSLGKDPELSQRLAEMGVLPGSRLQVLRHAPLGGTVEASVDDGETLALRTSELGQMRCAFTALPLGVAAGFLAPPLRIRALQGGRGFRERMGERGLDPGRLIRIREAGPQRMVVVPEGGGQAVALGRGEALKIIVEPLSPPTPRAHTDPGP